MSLLTGMAVLITGVLIGVAISKLIVFQKSRATALAKQLDEVHAEYAAYQEKVDQHFRKTADLLNALSSNYGAMHQHLALGVQTLSQRNLPHVQDRPISQTNPDKPAISAHHYSETGSPGDDSPTEALSPPKDYAPKSKDDPGLLSHNYVSNKQKEQGMPQPISAEPT